LTIERRLCGRRRPDDQNDLPLPDRRGQRVREEQGHGENDSRPARRCYRCERESAPGEARSEPP